MLYLNTQCLTHVKHQLPFDELKNATINNYNTGMAC